MSDDPLKPGGALEGPLFRRFLDRLSQAREPDIGERIGVWRILRELGRGGSGVVFLAERADGAYEQQVALKWLRSDRPVPGGREVLARERELLASLDHPNIARLIDGGETEDGMRWFAMDYAPGETIDRAAARLDRSERLQLVATLCRAVHHAHGRSLIHGDIKPSNVLVDDCGRPRLVDFGISRLRRAGPGSSYGMTPDYASPEQREGADLTTASDIWQLGHLLEDLLGAAAMPADLRAIIDRATQDAPEDRYASAAAMAADIEAWLTTRPVAARDGGVSYRLSRLVQRNRALSVVIVLALMVILGGGAWLVAQLAEQRDTARAEARRAEAALADTEAALARAEALRDFLTNLFQATRPVRPRDELPSTEQILARGADRAKDPESAPPRERIAMLSTLGGVYLAQSQYEQAGSMIDEALALAREQESIGPVDHARALKQKADWLIRSGGKLERAEAMLQEAERHLPAGDDHWELLARIRIIRTWVERHRGNHVAALPLVESVYESMPDDADESAQAGLFDALSGLYRAAGDLEFAAAFRERATAAFRNVQGEEGQGYVVSLANSVGLHRALGRFERAEQTARKALALYDRIYPEPVDYRAALRRGLAKLLFGQGRIDEAFDELELSSNEYAASRGLEPDEWPLHYSHRGRFNVRLGRYDRAVAALERAYSLIQEQSDDFDARLVSTVKMLHAWTECRRGAQDVQFLEAINNPEEMHFARPRTQNQLREARAACHYNAGEVERGYAELEGLFEGSIPPNGLVDAADRRMLGARMLADLGRLDEAMALLDEAEQAFGEHDLGDHPVARRLQDLRSGLRQGSIDAH